MKTNILHIDESNRLEIYEEAARTLKDGGLVAFPTETVYGIGANALIPEVVKKIYEAKGRPSDNPLIVHVGDSRDVAKYVQEIPSVAYKLMEAFWPGPLTLIFRKNDCIPDLITGGLKTVALRVPSHPVARGIIKTSGLPIAAPSANISGKPSPTIANHVIEDLSGRVDIIVDGGNANIGLESTVLDLTQEKPMILRPGGVTKEMLEEVVGPVVMDGHLKQLDSKEVPKAPGMKYRHYAPKGHLNVYKGPGNLVIPRINEALLEASSQGLKTGVIATREDASKYQCDTVKVIGSKHDPEEVAANLFRMLREMDDHDVDVIYTRTYTEEAIGKATMNRLLKAAGNKLIVIEDQ